MGLSGVDDEISNDDDSTTVAAPLRTAPRPVRSHHGSAHRRLVGLRLVLLFRGGLRLLASSSCPLSSSSSSSSSLPSSSFQAHNPPVSPRVPVPPAGRCTAISVAPPRLGAALGGASSGPPGSAGAPGPRLVVLAAPEAPAPRRGVVAGARLRRALGATGKIWSCGNPGR